MNWPICLRLLRGVSFKGKWPLSPVFSPRTTRRRADIVRALRLLKPKTSFRSGYAYDNVLYVVARHLIELMFTPVDKV